MAAEEPGNDDVFVYRGGAQVVPMDVVRARVHPSISFIPAEAFVDRRKLEEVELCEGLLEIGDYAFMGCAILKCISMPSSVVRVGEGAFESCRLLNDVTSEGLQSISREVFAHCHSLKKITMPHVKDIGSLAFHETPLISTHLPNGVDTISSRAFSDGTFSTFRIPPLVTAIPQYLFDNCQRVVSLELPENIEKIGQEALAHCRSLRNVAIPAHADVGEDTFLHCEDLRGIFSAETETTVALKHRFDGLSIHKILYYQSFSPITSEDLVNATNLRSTTSRRALRRKLDPTGGQQDCLGMNPLHILACSTVQDLELYKKLIDCYPENLIVEDKWGASPLLYAVWGNAPSEIVQFLVDRYKSIYPDHEFNWKVMFDTLCRVNAPFIVIQKLYNLQQENFPEQKIDWMSPNGVLATLAKRNRYDDDSIRTLKSMTKCSIAKRVDAIGVKQWRSTILELFDEIRTCYNKQWLAAVKDELVRCESEYQTLKEATTILELALWKAKIISASRHSQGMDRRSKKMKVDASGLRQECRISCGADHVIQNVLPYLLPRDTDEDDVVSLSMSIESDTESSSDEG